MSGYKTVGFIGLGVMGEPITQTELELAVARLRAAAREDAAVLLAAAVKAANETINTRIDGVEATFEAKLSGATKWGAAAILGGNGVAALVAALVTTRVSPEQAAEAVRALLVAVL